MELHLDRLVHVNVELAEFVAEFPVPVLGALIERCVKVDASLLPPGTGRR